jgi:16S rRNA G966 N2-methylase RsmD
VDSPALKAQNGNAHTIFEQQWAVYRRFVDAGYMSHRSFYGMLHDLVAARTKPFSLLDLASGDASWSVGALAGTGIIDYTAVDLSKQALELAAKNAASLRCDAQVIARDFRDYLESPPRTWDIILIGFSFHHLVGEDKLSFARKLRNALGAEGEWIFFEPILDGGESRARYLERWKECLDQHWTGFTLEEKAIIWRHVSQCDYPESPERFEEIARQAGFAACERLLIDPYRFYCGFRAIV